MKLFADKDSSRFHLSRYHLRAGYAGFYLSERVCSPVASVSQTELFPAWLTLVYISRLHLVCRQGTRGHCFARATAESIAPERRADRVGLDLQLENRAIRSRYRVLREY